VAKWRCLGLVGGDGRIACGKDREQNPPGRLASESPAEMGGMARI
jgi:hypothetical protein